MKGLAERMDLTAGQNVPLVAATLTVRLQAAQGQQADLVALLLDDQGQVGADADFPNDAHSGEQEAAWPLPPL